MVTLPWSERDFGYDHLMRVNDQKTPWPLFMFAGHPLRLAVVGVILLTGLDLVLLVE